MAWVCRDLDQVTNQCLLWVEHVSMLDQFAITKAQMIMIGTPIISIYGLIIAFALFNNFAKRA